MKPQYGYGYARPEQGRVNLPPVDNSLSGIQLSQTGTTADNTTSVKPDETKLVDAKEIKLVEVIKTPVRTHLLRAGAVLIGRVSHYFMSSFQLDSMVY